MGPTRAPIPAHVEQTWASHGPIKFDPAGPNMCSNTLTQITWSPRHVTLTICISRLRSLRSDVNTTSNKLAHHGPWNAQEKEPSQAQPGTHALKHETLRKGPAQRAAHQQASPCMAWPESIKLSIQVTQVIILGISRLQLSMCILCSNLRSLLHPLLVRQWQP